MDCGTTISYGNVTLKNVLTESVDTQLVKDSTGVDPIGMRTSITCVADAHTSDVNMHGIGVKWAMNGSVPGLASGISALLRNMIMPRQRFVMTIGGQTVWDIRPGEGAAYPCETTAEGDAEDPFNTDIALGPFASCDVMAVAGAHSAKCRFRFEFTVPICDPDGDGQAGDILNLRYWVADDIDCRDWSTTRMYRGVFRIRRRSAEGVIMVQPHVLARNMALPPIDKRFRRERISFQESPNGLDLHFTIIDREINAQAPFPATKWSGTYSVSVPQGDIVTVSELTFQLWGDMRTPKTDLFTLAQRIIDTKLHFKEISTDATCIVLNQVWQESLEDNQISVHMTIRNTGAQRFLDTLAQNGSAFELGQRLDECSPPLTFETGGDNYTYDHDDVHAPGPTSLATVFMCALQTPCCPQSFGDGETQTETSDPYETTEITTSYPREALPKESDDDKALYSKSHDRRGYQWYRMTNHYHKDTGWRAFPKGKQCVPASNQDTVAFAQLHCPVSVREVRIHACRADEWPEVPKLTHWQDQYGVKYVLKDVAFDPCPVSLTADARHRLHECYMTLWYYMSRPLNAQQVGVYAAEQFNVGCLPYIDADNLHEAALKAGADNVTRVTDEVFVDPAEILGSWGITQ